MVFSSLSGGRLPGGEGSPTGEEAVVYVALAGLRGSPARSAAADQPAQLAQLYAKIRSQQSEPPATQDRQRPADVSKLFDVAQPSDPASDVGKLGRGAVDQGGRGDTPSPEAWAKADASARQKAPAQRLGAGADRAEGSFWAQIEPCWQKLPNVSSVAVTLEVSLNERGLIAVPPKIIRPTTAPPGQMRLIAEARALAAVSACVPYHVAAGVPRTVRVHFKASS